VSTLEQGGNGASLEGQRAAIVAEVERRGWTLIEVVAEVASGKAADRREQLQDALLRLDRGEASVLVVSRLDRLTRSLLDFAAESPTPSRPRAKFSRRRRSRRRWRCSRY
jgi:DNA invertase Pin-like site-specific DNA recombinase